MYAKEAAQASPRLLLHWCPLKSHRIAASAAERAPAPPESATGAAALVVVAGQALAQRGVQASDGTPAMLLIPEKEVIVRLG